MLDSYLESNIQKKIKIFSILHMKRSSTIKELSLKTKLNPASIISLINELNLDIQDMGEISKKSTNFILNIFDNVASIELFHAIYSNSNLLKCLHYMLDDKNDINFSEFAEQNYLTRPSAYRIRQSCVNYLKQIGLNVENNKVVGEEYRIRFLIALLHYKYGIDIVDIDDESIRIVREFVSATNDNISIELLENTSSAYGYFETLFILAWKRQKYPIKIPKNEDLELLKMPFIYPSLIKYIKNHIENKLNHKFSEDDYEYFYLVFCTTNNCILADKWTDEDKKFIFSAVTSIPKSNDLITRFSNDFSNSIWTSTAFRTVMVHFLKKCLLNLHCIIPDNHYYLDIQDNQIKSHIYKYLEQTLNNWKDENNIPYPLDKGQLYYLTTQIHSISKSFIKPIDMYIISDLTSEVEVLKLTLSQYFVHTRLNLIPVLFNTDDLNFIKKINNSIFLVNKMFANVIYKLNNNNNLVVPINIEVNEFDKNCIINAIIKMEEKIFYNSDIYKKIKDNF